MKIFNSIDEIVNAIKDCKDKEEVNLAVRALASVAVRYKGIVPSDFPQEALAGQVLISAMILSVKTM